MIPAYTINCTLLDSSGSASSTSIPFGTLLVQRARQLSTKLGDTPGAIIADLSSFFPKDKEPAIYTIWVSQVSTPSQFSITCASEHLRRHLVARDQAVVTLFNDLGGQGEEGSEGGDCDAGTYLVVLKRVDAQQRCVPVNFSAKEKGAIKQAILERQASEE